MTLEEIRSHWNELVPGREYEITENFCKYCGSTDLFLAVKLEPVLGSLAGTRMKFSARKVGVANCRGCGHESWS